MNRSAMMMRGIPSVQEYLVVLIAYLKQIPKNIMNFFYAIPELVTCLVVGPRTGGSAVQHAECSKGRKYQTGGRWA